MSDDVFSSQSSTSAMAQRPVVVAEHGPMAPVLSLGAVLLGLVWTLCLLGPAALIGAAAWALGCGGEGATLLASLSLGATVLGLMRVVDAPGVWHGR